MTTLANQAASAFQKMSSPELLPAQLAPHTLPQLCNFLLKSPMEPINEAVHKSLTKWENAATPSWSKTEAKSRARRVEIYEQLGLDEDQSALFDALFPPLYLAVFKSWYTTAREKAHDYYTRSYSNYLRESGGFTKEAVKGLERLTHDVVSRLADPESETQRQTRGMVVGYVQSGKTTHFNGLIARAGDAGYKLIIVLAGTTDILRAQTQLRLDKQLIGLPVVKPKSPHDTAYALYPADFFVDHRSNADFKSAFRWKRQTTSSHEYGAGEHLDDFTVIEPLRNPALPFYASENLHFLSAQIVVMKKKPQIIRKLVDDLKSFAEMDSFGALNGISVLIVDDESDWASLNTKDTTKKVQVADEDRTATNREIVELIKILPRAQYVGYTATPYANVFIDPKDEDGLFPRDYIISLPRPDDYMGATDFHDMEVADAEKFGNPALGGSNQTHHIRFVTSEDDEELQEAVDAYLLSGAIKLWRADQYADFKVQHHTMLVHTSHRQFKHEELKEEVLFALNAANPSVATAKSRLKNLWESDFEKFYDSKFGSPSWKEIESFLKESWAKIHAGADFFKQKGGKEHSISDGVVVINSDPEANNNYVPNFDTQTDCWKIFVGGQILSRGYTLRDLTISYYRRNPGAGDTAIQMARWFGYRRGYRDLVRLYIDPELYARFEGLCEVEEKLRKELAKYNDSHLPISPRVIRPMVINSVDAGKITADNKARHAKTLHNPKREYAEPVAFPANSISIEENKKLFEELLDESSSRGENYSIFATQTGVKKPKKFDAHWAVIDDSSLVLRFFQTFERSALEEVAEAGKLEDMMRFLQRFPNAVDNGIDRWLILSVIETASKTMSKGPQVGGLTLPLIEAKRRKSKSTATLIESRFNSIPGAASRENIAKALCGLTSTLTLTRPSKDLISSRQAVLLVCAVADQSNPGNPDSVVFSVQFPNNNLELENSMITFGD